MVLEANIAEVGATAARKERDVAMVSVVARERRVCGWPSRAWFPSRRIAAHASPKRQVVIGGGRIHLETKGDFEVCFPRKAVFGLDRTPSPKLAVQAVAKPRIHQPSVKPTRLSPNRHTHDAPAFSRARPISPRWRRRT